MKRYTVTCEGVPERGFDNKAMAVEYANSRKFQRPQKRYEIIDNYKPEFF